MRRGWGKSMHRPSLLAGVRDVAPAQPANVSIGMLFGASAVGVGLTPASATAFSLLAVAARAQLVAVELLGNDATAPVVVATILLINVRYVTFSAALAPKVEDLSWRWRAVIAYPLIDITYAVADTRFADADADAVHRGWYFLGVGASWVVVFTAATLAGTLLGRALGEQYHLSFMVPLLFIALLVSQIRSRPGLLAATVAGAVSMVAVGLPFNLGLLVAALVGAGVGTYLDARTPGVGA
ncbi:MAG: AzlC family ABC transporter permease [Haloferacaceae archaeon]